MTKSAVNPLDTFDAMVSKVKTHHDKIEGSVAAPDNKVKNTIICLSTSDKQRYTEVAKNHRLSLSSFIRLALDEYIQNHNWLN